MASSVTFAPEFSLVFVADSKDVEVPDSIAGKLIVSTSTCMVIGCQAAVDGETEFILGTIEEVDPGEEPAFEQVLMTPNRKIAIQSASCQIIAETSVPHQQTMVRVWVNHPTEPDRVIVGVD